MNQIEILNFITKHKGNCSEIKDECWNCPIDCYFSDTDEDTLKKAKYELSCIEGIDKEDTIKYIYTCLIKNIQDLIDRGQCIETIVSKIQDVEYD